MNSNGGANSLSPVVVSTNATCSAAVLNDNERICEGSAPYLTPRVVYGAEQFIRENPNGGWVAASNVVYKRFDDGGIRWPEARQKCLNLGNGATLAAIKNYEEWTVIRTTFSGMADGASWIGGSDSNNEGVWRWETSDGSGEIVTYFNWSSGQPDNASNEDCLEMYSSGEYNDFTCTLNRRFYICEYRFEN